MLSRLLSNASKIAVVVGMLVSSGIILRVAIWVRQYAPTGDDFAYLTILVSTFLVVIWGVGIHTLRRIRFYERLLAEGKT